MRIKLWATGNIDTLQREFWVAASAKTPTAFRRAMGYTINAIRDLAEEIPDQPTIAALAKAEAIALQFLANPQDKALVGKLDWAFMRAKQALMHIPSTRSARKGSAIALSRTAVADITQANVGNWSPAARECLRDAAARLQQASTSATNAASSGLFNQAARLVYQAAQAAGTPNVGALAKAKQLIQRGQLAEQGVRARLSVRSKAMIGGGSTRKFIVNLARKARVKQAMKYNTSNFTSNLFQLLWAMLNQSDPNKPRPGQEATLPWVKQYLVPGLKNLVRACPHEALVSYLTNALSTAQQIANAGEPISNVQWKGLATSLHNIHSRSEDLDTRSEYRITKAAKANSDDLARLGFDLVRQRGGNRFEVANKYDIPASSPMGADHTNAAAEQMARSVLRLFPNARIIYKSGYQHNGRWWAGVNFELPSGKSAKAAFQTGGAGFTMHMLREISTDCAHGFTQGGQRPWAASEACQRAMHSLQNWDESSDPVWMTKMRRLEEWARQGANAKDSSSAREACRQLATMSANLIKEIQRLPPDDEQARLQHGFNQTLERHLGRGGTMNAKASRKLIIKAAKALGVKSARKAANRQQIEALNKVYHDVSGLTDSPKYRTNPKQLSAAAHRIIQGRMQVAQDVGGFAFTKYREAQNLTLRGELTSQQFTSVCQLLDQAWKQARQG